MSNKERIAELKRERHEIYKTISNGALLKNEVHKEKTPSTKIVLIPLCLAGIALLYALTKS